MRRSVPIQRDVWPDGAIDVGTLGRDGRKELFVEEAGLDNWIFEKFEEEYERLERHGARRPFMGSLVPVRGSPLTVFALLCFVAFCICVFMRAIFGWTEAIIGLIAFLPGVLVLLLLLVIICFCGEVVYREMWETHIATFESRLSKHGLEFQLLSEQMNDEPFSRVGACVLFFFPTLAHRKREEALQALAVRKQMNPEYREEERLEEEKEAKFDEEDPPHMPSGLQILQGRDVRRNNARTPNPIASRQRARKEADADDPFNDFEDTVLIEDI
jgi:hypothetical protein